MLGKTEVEELALTACCQPIRAPSIAPVISGLAFTADNDGYLTMIKNEKRFKSGQNAPYLPPKKQGQLQVGHSLPLLSNNRPQSSLAFDYAIQKNKKWRYNKSSA
ncbi:hypothetical protein BCR41DRAFT_375587 [Lobosporangium transversale]|uniref:Uncharacterized protein n=1 Tax=Lobosporangium transversale TaxID=64571 RepID=A0A1Y2G7W6_9FUNG|nr:hypothetical protein BCR41DRAFT_375587 [Lobosporangium transversale]ORY98336.1 hypothetical protein BCR41DRAFT_375587 [Lobosporangium transversale]|eukprot:XP_021875747.1 hypothetical protein BCR41DRAFT_375587 [Lobosporangium transversale]